MIDFILSLYDKLIVIGFLLFAVAIVALIIWGVVASVLNKDDKE